MKSAFWEGVTDIILCIKLKCRYLSYDYINTHSITSKRLYK